MIVAISPHILESVWAEVALMLERALEKNPGDLDLDDVKGKIESGQYLLMCAVENDKILASFAVELVDTHRKTANIVLCGGSHLKEWLDDFMNTIRPLVRDQGCEAITIMGRKGWERKMKPFGFHETGRILEAAL